jgi:hypothetical protein
MAYIDTFGTPAKMICCVFPAMYQIEERRQPA